MTRTSFDPLIYDLIGELGHSPFDGEVFRAVPEGVDPLAFSSGGGRWGFPQNDAAPTSILYTSESEEGALAEVASYYRLLSPPPSKQLVVHRLAVALQKVVVLDMDILRRLGVNGETYADRAYRTPPARTQEIGATVNFLGLDGLRAPSARYKATNLMIMGDNFMLDRRLELLDSRPVDWRSWSDEHLPSPES